MALAGSFRVAISPLLQNFQNIGQQVQQQVQQQVGPAMQAVGSDGGSKIAGALGKSLKVGLAAATTVVAAAGTAVLGLGAAGLKAQAEIQQSMGGSSAVFDKSAGAVQDWAAAAAGSMGLSANAALETANKMGSLFQGSGIAVGQSATMSMEMSKRAADVASVMGVDLSSAMEAVTGAAKGNFTMMDNLGVAMNETTLANYAAAKGYQKQYSAMTQAEKVGVAYAMFMEKTAKYAGNFEKENTSLAGSMDILKGSWSNVLSSLGDPSMLKSAVGQLSKAISGVVEAVMAVLPSIVEGMGSMVTTVVPVLLETINKLVPTLVGMLTTTLPKLIDALVSALPGLIETLGQALIKLTPVLIGAVLQVFLGIVAVLPTLITTVVTFLISAVPQLIDAAYKLFFALIEVLPDILIQIANALPQVVTGIVTALIRNMPSLLQGGVRFFMALVDALPEILMAIVGGLADLIPQVIGAFMQMQPLLADAGSQVFGKLVESAGQALGGLWGRISGILSDIFGRIGQFFGGASGLGRDLVMGLWNGISSMTGWLIGKIREFSGAALDGIKSFFGIHSPSAVMRDQVGRMLGLGVGEGIARSTTQAISDAEAFSARVSGAMDISAKVSYGSSMPAIGGALGNTTIINQTVAKPEGMLDVYLQTRRASMAMG